MARACNPSTWESETGGLQVHGQPQLLSEALRNLGRPCFKNKEQKIGLGVELGDRMPLGSIPSTTKKSKIKFNISSQAWWHTL